MELQPHRVSSGSFLFVCLAAHKTAVFKAKVCTLIVYPSGYVIQNLDHEAICKTATLPEQSMGRLGTGEESVVHMMPGWDQH